MRTLLRVQVGGTNTTGATRSITAPELKPGGAGWGAFVERAVVPLLAYKPEGIELWTPGGMRKGETLLQADQMLEAKASRYPTAGFAEAWKPITDQVEVVFYGGCLGLDDSFKGLSTTAWLDRALDSYRMALDAGMSIAYDASAGPVDESKGEVAAEAQRRAQAFVGLLDAMGTRQYVEPYWIAGADWCRDLPAFVTDSFYRTIRDQGFAGYRPPSFLGRPELIRILDHAPCASGKWPDATGADVRAWVAECHGDGCSASIGADLAGYLEVSST